MDALDANTAAALKESGAHREQRLKASGQWDAFLARVAQLKVDCASKPERQAAWRTACAEFAMKPEDPSPDASEEGGSEVPASTFDGRSAATSEAVAWVSKNLAIAGVQASDAPSPDAWALLCWAKSSPSCAKTFWERLYVALLPTRPATDARRSWDRPIDDEKSAKQFVESMKKVRAIRDAVYPDQWAAMEAGLIEHPDPKRWVAMRDRVDAALAEQARWKACTTPIKNYQTGDGDGTDTAA